MNKGNRLTLYIFLSMIVGILIGYLIHSGTSPEFISRYAANAKLLTTIFLRLVQMIIAPLVFSTLVVGIAKLGDLRTVGRVGGKAMLWFISASLLSLLIGMFWVNFLHPGTGFSSMGGDAKAAEDVLSKTKSLSLADFVNHVVPKSIVEAMAANEILQIVIFSIFFGVAAAAAAEAAIDRGHDLVEAEAERDQRQAGADPGHQRPLRRIAVPLAGEVVGQGHGRPPARSLASSRARNTLRKVRITATTAS